MGDGLLNDFATDTDGPDELPIPVDLPVLPARRVTQVHCLAYRAWRPTKSMNLVATTCRFRHRGADGGERCERRDRVAAPFDYLNCGSWASTLYESSIGRSASRQCPEATGLRAPPGPPTSCHATGTGPTTPVARPAPDQLAWGISRAGSLRSRPRSNRARALAHARCRGRSARRRTRRPRWRPATRRP